MKVLALCTMTTLKYAISYFFSGKMARWTENLEERLIDLVQGYPWLYDVRHKSYRDKHKKSWRDIANALAADIDGKPRLCCQ